MWVGLFSTDSNKNFWGRSWELFSRFTWQFHQTALGFFMAEEYNIWGNVTKVSTKYGATVITTPNLGDSGRALTLGCFIIGNRYIEASPDNDTFRHEYGHYLQSQSFGPIYMFWHAPLSLFSAMGDGDHRIFKTEKDANSLAFDYFMKNGIITFGDWNQEKFPLYGWAYNKWLNR